MATIPERQSRRIYLIGKSLQLKFTALVLSLFLLAALGVWLNAYVHFSKLQPEIGDTQYLSMLYALNRVIMVQLGTSLVLVAVVAILFSHLIAGPAYHLKKVMDLVRQGDMSQRVRLRKWDELKDVAESFNNMMDSFQKK